MSGKVFPWNFDGITVKIRRDEKDDESNDR